jgi:hypothetical protein
LEPGRVSLHSQRWSTNRRNLSIEMARPLAGSI